MAIAGAIRRFRGLVEYNRDWLPYITARVLSSDKQDYHLRNGQTVHVPADSRWTLNEIFVDRAYDVPGVEWSQCRNILDLGANVGAWSLYAAAKAPGARIHAFEPSAANYSILQKNLHRNSIRSSAYQLAVGGACCEAHINTTGRSVNHALAATGQQVTCITLARLFDLTGVDVFDLAKIDIEGAEREMLSACSDEELLRFRAIAMEWHPPSVEMRPIIDRLQRLGFHAAAYPGKFIKARR